MNGEIKIKGQFKVTCRNPDGSIAWEEIVDNGNTTAGLNAILDTFFPPSSAQITTWYIGCINNAGFVALAAADTMGSKQWSEFINYTGPRPTWTVLAAAGGTKASNGVVTISILANGTIQGLFICSNNTLGGLTGVLYSTALLSSPRAVANGQTLDLSYSTTLTPS
jgi:hypothetical protein